MGDDVIHDDDALMTSGQPSSLTSLSDTVESLIETVLRLILMTSCQQPLKPEHRQHNTVIDGVQKQPAHGF